MSEADRIRLSKMIAAYSLDLGKELGATTGQVIFAVHVAVTGIMAESGNTTPEIRKRVFDAASNYYRAMGELGDQIDVDKLARQ